MAMARARWKVERQEAPEVEKRGAGRQAGRQEGFAELTNEGGQCEQVFVKPVNLKGWRKDER